MNEGIFWVGPCVFLWSRRNNFCAGFGCYMQFTVFRQVNGSGFSFDQYECLWKWFKLQDRGVGHFSVTADSVFHFQKYICHIFAFYFCVDARSVAVQCIDFTKKKPASIQNM